MREAVSSRKRRSDYGTTTQAKRQPDDGGDQRPRSEHAQQGATTSVMEAITGEYSRLRSDYATGLPDSRLPTATLPALSEQRTRRSRTSSERMAQPGETARASQRR